MGWPTKTNCDTPRPTLGNPASLLPYVYNPRPLTEQERHAFCNPPAPDPRPVATRPYTDVVTLTDADDLADFLPSAPPTPIAVAQPPIDTPSNLADIAENTGTPSTHPCLDLALGTQHLALVSPCLSPAGTSLTEPDNSRRVH